jgi:hypothetical protein
MAGKMKTGKNDSRPNLRAAHEWVNAGQLTDRLRGMVLLAGSVRANELSRAIGRSILDLPIGFGGTVLGRWMNEANQLAATLGLDRLSVQVLVAHGSRIPSPPKSSGPARIAVERDPREFAGTGGVLRDVAEQHDAEGLLLIGNAGEVLTRPLAELAALLDRSGGDMTLLSRGDGTAIGLMLASCRALRAIRGGGFVDLKEQALPQLAAEFDIRVAVTEASSIGIRTLDGYLSAVRVVHRTAAGELDMNNLPTEEWYKTFEVVEDGARVASPSVLHDSVVLRGGVVERGAVVVRSVVGPGGVARTGSILSDRVIGAPHPSGGAEEA